MRKFLKVALNPQWKTVLLIFALVIIQTLFQMEIIDLFSQALTGVKSQKINMLFESGLYMLVYTILSMICMYVVSFLSTRVSSNAAYTLREKIFHILMNLPDNEIDKFKISGLVTRSNRGVYSEQGFIAMILQQLILIPVTFILVIYEIALIDRFYAIFFIAFIAILSAIIILRMKKIIEIFFRAKKTYGKLNLLFLSKITDIAGKIPFKKEDYEFEFEKACENSYDKNVKYLLSQYYLGPVLIWGLYVIVLITFAMINSGYSIGFETNSLIDSLIILIYIAYFISTLAVIPALIDRWPRAYATSVRLEEVLTLEKKIITSKNSNNPPKRIKIPEEDIKQEYKEISFDRKDILRKFAKILKQEKIEVIISSILLTLSTLCIAYAPKIAGKTVNLMASNLNSSNNYSIFTNIALLIILYSIGHLFKLTPKRIMGVIGEKVAYNLRMELFDKLDIIGSGFIQENTKGHILSRLNNELMNIREFISSRFSEIYAQFLSIIIVTILILMTDMRLGLIYIAILPVYSICFHLCDVKSKTYYDSHQKHLGRLMSYFERGLSNRSSLHERHEKN